LQGEGLRPYVGVRFWVTGTNTTAVNKNTDAISSGQRSITMVLKAYDFEDVFPDNYDEDKV